MELWVRSQDKMLLAKPKTIGAYYFGANKKATIRIKSDEEFSTAFGLYKSMERAKEVLDEIQSLLLISKGFRGEDKYTGTGFYSVDNELAIYEMPEE